MDGTIDRDAQASLLAIVIIVAVVVISFLACLDDPEQPVRFTVRTSSEVEVGRNPSGACTSECKPPQTVNRHRAFFRAFEQTTESAVFVESHDCATAKIANQQLVGMRTEADRRQGDSPGGVHFTNRPAR